MRPIRSRLRERFRLPDGHHLSRRQFARRSAEATPGRLAEVVERQWGEDLITSWNRHGWIDWPQRIAAKLAPIVGAKPNELLIADSTTVCLFKLLAAAVAARPGRTTILTQQGNFPTDIYAAEGLVGLQPQSEAESRPGRRPDPGAWTRTRRSCS